MGRGGVGTPWHAHRELLQGVSVQTVASAGFLVVSDCGRWVRPRGRALRALPSALPYPTLASPLVPSDPPGHLVARAEPGRASWSRQQHSNMLLRHAPSTRMSDPTRPAPPRTRAARAGPPQPSFPPPCWFRPSLSCYLPRSTAKHLPPPAPGRLCRPGAFWLADSLSSAPRGDARRMSASRPAPPAARAPDTVSRTSPPTGAVSECTARGGIKRGKKSRTAQ